MFAAKSLPNKLIMDENLAFFKNLDKSQTSKTYSVRRNHFTDSLHLQYVINASTESKQADLKY